MPKTSAGLLLYRLSSGRLEVLLGHPGGPLWTHKDEGIWSIPKGEFKSGEEPLAAARREFAEETGFAPAGGLIPLEPLVMPSGKTIYAWAVQGEFDPADLRSNAFSMEWPPNSGRRQEFPELDRVAWFVLEAAYQKILRGQAGFLTQLWGKIEGA